MKGTRAARRGRLASQWTRVGGLRLHARVSAEPVPAGSPPVVLVHGLVVSSRYMVPTAVRLAPYYRVYVPDLPGYGKSAKPRHVLNVSEMADALAAWMEAAGLSRAALLGNSVGCQVAADFAARYPERTERVVLAGPTMDPHAPTAWQQIGRWLVDAIQELQLAPIIARDLWDMGPRRALRTFQYSLQDRIEHKLPCLRAPTLVVRGGRDPCVSQRWAEEAARLLPQGRLVVLPGAPHTVNFSAPDALVRVVRPFLDEAPAGSARVA